jgi:hypothetical protein
MQSECMPGPEYFCFNLQAVELTDKLWIARFNHLSEVAADSCLDHQEDREFERFHKLRQYLAQNVASGQALDQEPEKPPWIITLYDSFKFLLADLNILSDPLRKLNLARPA